MKYIISESKLQNFIIHYIDTILKPNNVYEMGDFILVDSPWEFGIERDVIMEYDPWDGRLWVSKEFCHKIYHLFDVLPEEALKLLKDRFEKVLGVKVGYVESK